MLPLPPKVLHFVCVWGCGGEGKYPNFYVFQHVSLPPQPPLHLRHLLGVVVEVEGTCAEKHKNYDNFGAATTPKVFC